MSLQISRQRCPCCFIFVHTCHSVQRLYGGMYLENFKVLLSVPWSYYELQVLTLQITEVGFFLSHLLKFQQHIYFCSLAGQGQQQHVRH